MSEYKENQFMSEEEIESGQKTAGFTVEEDIIDLGGGVASGFDPFADDVANATVSEQKAESPKVVESVSSETNPPPQGTLSVPELSSEVKKISVEKPSGNPFDAAIAASETKQAEENKAGLIGRPPIFEYAAAKEEISDTAKTFEELRAEKAADFPELEEASRVTWSVTYGKTTKTVSDPKGTTVAKMKSDIEQSKDFLDGLKKIKGEIVCKVTPKVTAQKKGELSSYRGVFTSVEAAVASGKVISIVPSDDGNVYEIRNNEIGRFVTKARNTKGLSTVRAGFTPALPAIPYAVICQVITFFKSFMNAGHETEALVNVYWDKELSLYHVHAPKQMVSKCQVEAQPADIDPTRYIHVMEIHSHNTMAAKFSPTDDADEKATRLYMVIGRLNQLFPEISVRIASGGSFVEIDPLSVFDGDYVGFPAEWLENITIDDRRTENV